MRSLVDQITTKQLPSNFLRIDEDLDALNDGLYTFTGNEATTPYATNWNKALLLEATVTSSPDNTSGIHYRSISLAPEQSYKLNIVEEKIGDQIKSCIVRCAFDAANPDEEPGITMNRDDVTLYAGDTFYLYLKNPDDSNVQGVEWTATEEGFVEIDGNKITALDITEKKIIYVTTEHEGVEYKCMIRLYPPKQEVADTET